jgi:ketosteroid isomerase-like protein
LGGFTGSVERIAFATVFVDGLVASTSGARSRGLEEWAMSQENVEIVRSAFQAFQRGDMEGVLQVCDEEVKVTQDAELVELLGISRQQVGHAGVREAFAVWPEQWDDFSLEVLTTRDLGVYVIAATVNRGRGKDSGVRVEMPFTFLFSVRSGKIMEWRIFMREEKALEAAGLAE